MSEMGQEDIDKLLADALGGNDDSSESPMGQDEIDALLAGNAENKNADDSTPMGQDDIDALLASNTEDDSAPMGQDDIDALLASNTEDDSAPMGQDDIDALLASNTEDDSTPMGQDDIDTLLASNTENDTSDASMGQDDIDALLAGNTEDDTSDASMEQDDIDALLAGNTEDNTSDASMRQDDIDALLAGNTEDNTSDASMGQDDIDALLAGNIKDTNNSDALVGNTEIKESGSLGQDAIDELLADSQNITEISQETKNENSLKDNSLSGAMDQNEIDALLTDALEDNVDSTLSDLNINEKTEEITENKESISVSENTSKTLTKPSINEEIQKPIITPESQKINSYVPPLQPQEPAPAPQLSAEQIQNIQENLSLSGSSGEVENLAGQMSGLLGQLSERARRFQSAWLIADQENRDLRNAITLNQQKIHILNSEKQSLLTEIDSLRKQYSQIEGEKLASSEAHRTEIASLELQLREQESRNNMISSEIKSLKEELERARNETTGSDLESRRSRFELERITNELASEKQERQRLARALENREKELQAMQAQSAGHASTLFLDELHRLVRRLESELDIRTSAANEGLSIIDRMEFTSQQEMYASTLRSTIAAAAGITPDENDALKILDNQSEIKQQTLEPAPPPGEDSFKAAIERYDFAKASGIASAAMRSGEKAPIEFIKQIHKTNILKRPEISQYLDDIAAMLKGIKNLQEASDRARGKEGEVTEILYVLIFDYLHTLVRMKLITRATTAMWELFLELRGHFSFLTSDRQWKEYRNRLLSGNKIALN